MSKQINLICNIKVRRMKNLNDNLLTITLLLVLFMNGCNSAPVVCYKVAYSTNIN